MPEALSSWIQRTQPALPRNTLMGSASFLLRLKYSLTLSARVVFRAAQCEVPIFGGVGSSLLSV